MRYYLPPPSVMLRAPKAWPPREPFGAVPDAMQTASHEACLKGCIVLWSSSTSKRKVCIDQCGRVHSLAIGLSDAAEQRRKNTYGLIAVGVVSVAALVLALRKR